MERPARCPADIELKRRAAGSMAAMADGATDAVRERSAPRVRRSSGMYEGGPWWSRGKDVLTAEAVREASRRCPRPSNPRHPIRLSTYCTRTDVTALKGTAECRRLPAANAAAPACPPARASVLLGQTRRLARGSMGASMING